MNKYIGSSLEEFLEEEGMLEEVRAAAVKEVLVFQIMREMKRQKISKKALAERLNTSRAALDRWLDPHNPSITLNTAVNLAAALGKKVKVELI